MPPALTYPGVYIEELPSGVHTITGVATSIAAFIGWAPQGPTTKAVLVESATEFASLYGGTGGLSNFNGVPNYLGYAVNQFFANGGSQAYIIRLVWDGTLPTAVLPAPTACATAKATVGGSLSLFASSPGQWANGTATAGIFVSVILQPSPATGFTVQVLDSSGNVLESFVNLSVDPTNPEYVVTAINNDSQYITFIDPAHVSATIAVPAMPTATASGGTALAGGVDGEVLIPGGNGDFELALGSISSSTYGVHLLDKVEIFNLLCVPGETDCGTIVNLQEYCWSKRAFYIVDCPRTATVATLNAGPIGTGTAASLVGTNSENSAYYFPWVLAQDPLVSNRPALFPPCGFVAGIYASTDANRGVWKAPAGIGAGLSGALGIQYNLQDADSGVLNPLAINCLRNFQNYGDVVWGARTLQGNDNVGPQWKYIPIRRLALFLESSLYNGTQWVVFEPNDEPLWGQIRLNVGSFLQGLFLQGAFQGTSPQQAYFVKCDSENNPQSSIDQGIVNILVGFAPLYPAEFVVIQIQQMAGQS
ncbi:MAG: phage tail sheath C-terminal domain-containing protein [Opitutaceae bacterium]|jgi:phage tail sheath protein FI